MRYSAIASILLAASAAAIPVNLDERQPDGSKKFDGPYALELWLDNHGPSYYVEPYQLSGGKIITVTSNIARTLDYYYTRIYEQGEIGINGGGHTAQGMTGYDDQGLLAWAPYNQVPKLSGKPEDQSPLKGLWADESGFVTRWVGKRSETTFFSCSVAALKTYVETAGFWAGDGEAKHMVSQIPDTFNGLVILSIEVGYPGAGRNVDNVNFARRAGCQESRMQFVDPDLAKGAPRHGPPNGL